MRSQITANTQQQGCCYNNNNQQQSTNQKNCQRQTASTTTANNNQPTTYRQSITTIINNANNHQQSTDNMHATSKIAPPAINQHKVQQSKQHNQQHASDHVQRSCKQYWTKAMQTTICAEHGSATCDTQDARTHAAVPDNLSFKPHDATSRCPSAVLFVSYVAYLVSSVAVDCCG